MSSFLKKFPVAPDDIPLTPDECMKISKTLGITSDQTTIQYLSAHEISPPDTHYDNYLPVHEDLPMLDKEVVGKIEKENKLRREKRVFNKNTTKPSTAEDMPKKGDRSGPKLLNYFMSTGRLFTKKFRTPYCFIEGSGYWCPLTTEDGRDEFLASLSEEELMNLDSDSVDKLADAILASNQIKASELEAPSPYLINFRDAVFNVKTEEILPHDSSYMFTYCINATTDMIASDYHDGSLLSTYLEKSFNGNQEKVDTLGEIFGVAISSIRDQKQMFYLYGPASCGKSVALNILHGLICEEFVTSLSFKQLGGDFELSELCGSCLNLSSEIPTIKGKAAEILKRITGNDISHGKRKGKTGRKMLVRALLVFATNTLPHVAGDDEAFYSRFRVLRYDHTIPKTEWIRNIDRIILKDELGYVLRFAIEGLKRYIANGMEITGKEESDSFVYESRLEENSFSDFASQFISVSDNDIVMNEELFSAYNDYCNRNHLKPKCDRDCSQILTSCYNATRYKKGKSRSRGYKGIRLSYFADYL